MATTASTAIMFVGDQCGRTNEAVAYYAAHVPGVSVNKLVVIDDASDPRVGDVRRAEFTIGDARFIAFDSALPHAFSLTPAISIWLDLDNDDQIQTVFETLADGGATHMPLGDYGFSRRFGWVDDRFGVSWQLNLPL